MVVSTSELPGWITIRMKSQWCLIRQVCNASSDGLKRSGGAASCAEGHTVQGQVAACLLAAAAVLLGRSGVNLTVRN